MKLTDRDIRLVKDIALSHVMSRDQILELGYFTSVTRVNTRLRELARLSLVRRLDTPFFGQSLYMAGRNAQEISGGRIAQLLDKRTSSPRFVQHALSVTNVRIALIKKGAGEWRFEQQLKMAFTADRRFEIRPDGLFMATKLPLFIEVDLGHVNPAKFKEKLLAYRSFVHSGNCEAIYCSQTFRLLTITTGTARSRNLRQLLPPNPGFEFLVQTFEELGISKVSAWS